MKVAVIGSRGLTLENFSDYIPSGTTELVSGGACGIDTCVREWAVRHNYTLREFLPNYSKYGKRAPLIRNLEILDYTDMVIAFWDGKSRGTAHTIHVAKQRGIPVTLYII